MPITPATRPRAAPAARRPPPPARRPPPPAARRVREDSDWREELATRKVPPGTGKGLPGKEGGGKENEDFLFVPDDGTPSADAVEDLYSLDGGWSVELVTEEEETLEDAKKFLSAEINADVFVLSEDQAQEVHARKAKQAMPMKPSIFLE